MTMSSSDLAMLRAAALRSETVPKLASARIDPARAGENARVNEGRAPVEEEPAERGAVLREDMMRRELLTRSLKGLVDESKCGAKRRTEVRRLKDCEETVDCVSTRCFRLESHQRSHPGLYTLAAPTLGLPEWGTETTKSFPLSYRSC